MLVISESGKGAVTLVFHTEEEILHFKDNLEKLIEYKKLPGETYPATYTEHLVINKNEKEIEDHINAAKRVVKILA